VETVRNQRTGEGEGERRPCRKKKKKKKMLKGKREKRLAESGMAQEGGSAARRGRVRWTDWTGAKGG
jgi:hypothetical protein